MNVLILQPKNPYSLRELEVRFGFDLSKYTASEKSMYRFENKGRLANDVIKIQSLKKEELWLKAN